jgi:hypothetical protein
MAGTPSSTPFYPFEQPGHAVLLLVLGLVVWTIGTAARACTANPKQFREIQRPNPWTLLFKGRPATDQEVRSQLPDWFFLIYRAFWKVAQYLGVIIGMLGLVGLVVSLAKILF